MHSSYTKNMVKIKLLLYNIYVNENEILQWSALEYEDKERGADWFWALAVIIIAGALTAIIYSDYFFAVLLVLCGVMLGFFAIKRPDRISYELNDKGLKMGTRFFPFENITAFYIQTEHKPLLFIKSSRLFIPIISMPIDPAMASHIHELFLFKNITEEQMQEHTSEKIMDALGF